MAFPTVPTVAAGRVLTANQADTSATRTFPDLSGLTKNAGDLLIAICVAYQTSTGTNAAFSGWTGGFSEFHDSATSTTLAIGIAYKWSDGTESGTFAVTQAATITGHASFILLSIPGAHPSTPPEAGGRTSGTSAAADPASFNPAGWDVEDTLWIAVGGSGMTSGTGSWTAMGTSAPGSYTDRVDTNTTDNSVVGQTEAVVAFRQNAIAAENPGTFGPDLSNARNAALVVAVRPAAPPNEGAATGAVGWAGSATGATEQSGAASGSIGWVGSSAGVRVPKSTGSGAVTWVGSATGEAPIPPIPEGEALGTVTWAGTATGTTTRSGSGSGSVGWPGNATGAADHSGASTGAIIWTGSAAGTTSYVGDASGTITWTGSATGDAPTVGAQEGSADGSISWVGTATGTADHEGAASGTIVWAGSAEGAIGYQGAAVGAVVWSGTAVGSSGDFYRLDVIPGKLGTGYLTPVAGTGWTPGAPIATKAAARLGGRWIPGRLRL